MAATVSIPPLPPSNNETHASFDLKDLQIEGRLFCSLDAVTHPDWKVTPKIGLRFGDWSSKQQQDFLNAHPHQCKHEATADHIEHAEKSPDEPPKIENLNELGTRLASGKWMCGMIGCNKEFKTLEHLRQHMRGGAHFSYKFYECAQCNKRFHHNHDCTKHVIKFHTGQEGEEATAATAPINQRRRRNSARVARDGPSSGIEDTENIVAAASITARHVPTMRNPNPVQRGILPMPPSNEGIPASNVDPLLVSSTSSIQQAPVRLDRTHRRHDSRHLPYTRQQNDIQPATISGGIVPRNGVDQYIGHLASTSQVNMTSNPVSQWRESNAFHHDPEAVFSPYPFGPDSMHGPSGVPQPYASLSPQLGIPASMEIPTYQSPHAPYLTPPYGGMNIASTSQAQYPADAWNAPIGVEAPLHQNQPHSSQLL